MNTAPKSEITKMLDNILFWYKETPVKSPEECAERLNKFFNRVRETGEIPTVEKMALSLGLTAQSLSNWENAKDLEIRECHEMAKKAKSIIAAMDAELAANGAIDRTVYIFRSKNYYGMSDETKIEISAKTNVENIDEKELAQRILEDKESYKK